jgi:hypothetical protein
LGTPVCYYTSSEKNSFNLQSSIWVCVWLVIGMGSEKATSSLREGGIVFEAYTAITCG